MIMDNGAGVRPLMSRALDIPNKEVMDFIETDITVLMRQYQIVWQMLLRLLDSLAIDIWITS